MKKNKLGPDQPAPASVEAVYAASNAWVRSQAAEAALSAKWDYRLVDNKNMAAWMEDCSSTQAITRLCYLKRIFRTEV